MKIGFIYSVGFRTSYGKQRNQIYDWNVRLICCLQEKLNLRVVQLMHVGINDYKCQHSSWAIKVDWFENKRSIRKTNEAISRLPSIYLSLKFQTNQLNSRESAEKPTRTLTFNPSFQCHASRIITNYRKTPDDLLLNTPRDAPATGHKSPLSQFTAQPHSVPAEPELLTLTHNEPPSVCLLLTRGCDATAWPQGQPRAASSAGSKVRAAAGQKVAAPVTPRAMALVCWAPRRPWATTHDAAGSADKSMFPGGRRVEMTDVGGYVCVERGGGRS